jgi:hypothetical protein
MVVRLSALRDITVSLRKYQAVKRYVTVRVVVRRVLFRKEEH